MSNQPKQVRDIIATALAIEAAEAQKAGALGYMARAMVQATMPHKNPPTRSTNELTMRAASAA